MNTVDIAVKAAGELGETLSRIDPAEVAKLVEAVAKAKVIFVGGAGRSLLMMRALAMRLVHLGLAAHVVGDVTTPAFTADDLLIIGTSTGETACGAVFAAQAKKHGGRLAALTTFPDSTIGRLADLTVRIPSYTRRLPESPANRRTMHHFGSVFEQSLLLLCDSLVETLAAGRGIDTHDMFGLHANLE